MTIDIDEIARVIGLMVMTFGGMGIVFLIITWMICKFGYFKFVIMGLRYAYKEKMKK